MSFNSLLFLAFFPIVALVHRFLPAKLRWIWLLAASYCFYMSWNAALVFLILGTTLVSYLAGLLIARTQKKGVKRFWLVLTLVVCLGTLAFFKYINFLLSSVIGFLNLFSLGLDPITLNVILPVGISFYTFQTLSYVIDVYRGKFPPERHFGYYALFVSFFPQLVAGPIERPENLLPQLRAAGRGSAEDVQTGLRFMLYGFFKKIAVADFVGGFVTSAFSEIGANNGLSLWAAAILFTVQIYCDFSGYSDIATGCARIMGIKLMKNFDRPFLATSIREYGRRWHISLNSWFMEYVYFPLGGSRRGKVRKYLNILIVFTLSGLWHGASWTFVIWGALIGVYTVIEDLLRPLWHKVRDKWKIDTDNAFVKLLRRCILALMIGFTSVFFRAQSVSDAFLIVSKLFTDWSFGGGYLTETFAALSLDLTGLVRLVLALVLVAVGYYICFPRENDLFSPSAKGVSVEALRCCVCFFMVALVALVWLEALSSGTGSAFLYFQF